MEFVVEAPEVGLPHVRTWTITPDSALKNRVIDDVIRHLSQHRELGPSLLFKSRLCLDEALSNAISHGCRGVDDPHVTVDFYCEAPRWAVRVRDEGEGFEVESVPSPDDPDNETRESGRGILILERYTERIVFADRGRVQTLWMTVEDAE